MSAAPTATATPTAGPLGIWLFLVSDAVTFLALVTALFALRLRGGDGFHAPAEVVPSATLALGLTAILMWSGAHAATAMSARPRLHLAIAALLGIGFLFGQAHEWSGLIALHFTPGSSQFASLFFVATGFHGLHVAAGIALLLGAIITNSSIRVVALYWLFVDLLWSLLLVSFYLV